MAREQVLIQSSMGMLSEVSGTLNSALWGLIELTTTIHRLTVTYFFPYPQMELSYLSILG